MICFRNSPKSNRWPQNTPSQQIFIFITQMFIYQHLLQGLPFLGTQTVNCKTVNLVQSNSDPYMERLILSHLSSSSKAHDGAPF
jgi:hypothetical protein